jgi:hypothetical protein
VQLGNPQFQQVTYEKPKKKPGCAFLLLPLFGLIMLGVGLWFGYSSYEFSSAGFEVEGTVVRLVESRGEDGTTYSPVYGYTIDGQHYEYQSINSANPPNRRVGEVSTLLIDPNDHGRARENSFWELWLLPAVLIPTAVFMLLLAVAIPIIARVTG